MQAGYGQAQTAPPEQDVFTAIKSTLTNLCNEAEAEACDLHNLADRIYGCRPPSEKDQAATLTAVSNGHIYDTNALLSRLIAAFKSINDAKGRLITLG